MTFSVPVPLCSTIYLSLCLSVRLSGISVSPSLFRSFFLCISLYDDSNYDDDDDNNNNNNNNNKYNKNNKNTTTNNNITMMMTINNIYVAYFHDCLHRMRLTLKNATLKYLQRRREKHINKAQTKLADDTMLKIRTRLILLAYTSTISRPYMSFPFNPYDRLSLYLPASFFFQLFFHCFSLIPCVLKAPPPLFSLSKFYASIHHSVHLSI